MRHKESVKFIQISDSHLFSNAEQRLIGVDTAASLKAVIELVAEEKDVAGIIASGDLSQDNSLGSYQLFEAILQVLSAPVYWIPGNHDNSARFHQPPGEFPLPTRSVVNAGKWRILLLDSVIPGDESGHLANTELDYINKNVHDDGMYTILVLHHQPIPCGSAWLDSMILNNADDFLRLISSRPGIRAVLNGHIHQARQQEIGGISFISTPSTCFQFTPETDEFSLDTRMPGYRRLLLNVDGSIETEVVRLKDFDLNLEHTVQGY